MELTVLQRHTPRIRPRSLTRVIQPPTISSMTPLRCVPRLRALNVGTVKEERVIEAKATFGRAGEIGAHHDLPRDIGAEGGAGGGDEVVDVFDDVDVDFVAAVFDVGAAVRHGPGRLVGDARRVFSLDTLDAGRGGWVAVGGTTARSDLIDSVVMYICSESMSDVCGYPKSRISAISTGIGGREWEDAIKQLVDKHKVVLHALLVQLAKVRAANAVDKAVEELEDTGGVGVDLCDGDNVDVVALDVEEGGGAERRDGRADVGRGQDLDAEDVGDRALEVVAVQPRDQHLALLVEDEDAADHRGAGGARKGGGGGDGDPRDGGVQFRDG